MANAVRDVIDACSKIGVTVSYEHHEYPFPLLDPSITIDGPIGRVGPGCPPIGGLDDIVARGDLLEVTVEGPRHFVLALRGKLQGQRILPVKEGAKQVTHLDRKVVNLLPEAQGLWETLQKVAPYLKEEDIYYETNEYGDKVLNRLVAQKKIYLVTGIDARHLYISFRLPLRVDVDWIGWFKSTTLSLIERDQELRERDKDISGDRLARWEKEERERVERRIKALGKQGDETALVDKS